jgi:hypothetical protein
VAATARTRVTRGGRLSRLQFLVWALTRDELRAASRELLPLPLPPLALNTKPLGGLNTEAFGLNTEPLGGKRRGEESRTASSRELPPVRGGGGRGRRAGIVE